MRGSLETRFLSKFPHFNMYFVLKLLSVGTIGWCPRITRRFGKVRFLSALIFVHIKAFQHSEICLSFFSYRQIFWFFFHYITSLINYVHPGQLYLFFSLTSSYSFSFSILIILFMYKSAFIWSNNPSASEHSRRHPCDPGLQIVDQTPTGLSHNIHGRRLRPCCFPGIGTIHCQWTSSDQKIV